MFGFGKKPQYLNQELKELKQRDETISALKQEIEDLRKNRTKRLEQEMRDSAFAVDWRAMRVTAIERNLKDGSLCTIIGYLIDDDKGTHMREWYLYCNEETHHRLVKEFCEYKGA